MKKLYVFLAIAGFVLTGCSTTNVKPSYVSPTKYQSLDCSQLNAEYDRISQYLASGVQSNRQFGSGIGIGLGGGWGSHGWGISPSISIDVGRMTGVNSKRTQIAELLGQQDAIAQAAQYKHCQINHPRQITTKKSS